MRAVGRQRFIIDDEPLRRLRKAAGAGLFWLRRRAAEARAVAKALGLVMSRPSLTVVHVQEPSASSSSRSRTYEKVSLTDAVASSIMRRYGIEGFFSGEARELRRSPP